MKTKLYSMPKRKETLFEKIIMNSKNDAFLSFLIRKNIFSQSYIENFLEKNHLDARTIYHLAQNISEIPVYLLAKAMAKTKNAEYIYYFAKNVSTAPLDTLIEGILSTRDPYYICEFASHVTGISLPDFEKKVLELDLPEILLSFATTVEGASIDLIADKLIEVKNPNYLHRFLQTVPNAPKEKIVDAIIATKDVDTMVYCAKEWDGLYYNRVIDGLLKTKNAEKIYDFSLRNIAIPVPLFAQTLLETKSICHIAKFLKRFYRMDIPNLKEKIRSLDEQCFSLPVEDFIQKVIEVNFSSMEKLEKYKLLKQWLNEENLLLVECYGEYLLKENATLEEKHLCDENYHKKLIEQTKTSQKVFVPSLRITK